ncbi:Protoheme IX farnesyltransferase [Fusarium oxysporum f. sp. albedinis]|nr:Protoheme IX farnesyltransferase [Fusarium oxysporum f. sp. albedinis]
MMNRMAAPPGRRGSLKHCQDIHWTGMYSQDDRHLVQRISVRSRQASSRDSPRNLTHARRSLPVKLSGGTWRIPYFHGPEIL